MTFPWNIYIGLYIEAFFAASSFMPSYMLRISRKLSGYIWSNQCVREDEHNDFTPIRLYWCHGTGLEADQF